MVVGHLRLGVGRRRGADGPLTHINKHTIRATILYSSVTFFYDGNMHYSQLVITTTNYYESIFLIDHIAHSSCNVSALIIM